MLMFSVQSHLFVFKKENHYEQENFLEKE